MLRVCVGAVTEFVSPVCLISSPSVLKQCKDVELSFSDVTGKPDIFKGTKKGMLYLTPYRVSLSSAGMLLSQGILETLNLVVERRRDFLWWKEALTALGRRRKGGNRIVHVTIPITYRGTECSPGNHCLENVFHIMCQVIILPLQTLIAYP